MCIRDSHTASKSLNELRVTRTKAMSRKMQDVATLDSVESERILEISEGDSGEREYEVEDKD